MVSGKSLNILFSSTYFYPYLSGLSEYLLKIARHYVKKHNVSVLVFQHQSNLARLEEYQNIKIIRVPVHVKLSKGLWNFFYPYIALRELKKNDIIFINLPQFEGFFLALWGKILKKKVYCIFHCELNFEHGWWSQAIAFIANLSAFLSCLLSDKIITYTKDYAKHSIILKHFFAKIVYIFPPVKMTAINKKYYRLLNKKFAINKPIIGFSGRVAREKGLEYILKSLVRLRKFYPKLAFLIAGPFGQDVVGENGYYQKLKNIVLRDSLPVEYLGRLSSGELTSFYKFIDLLVLPSVNKTEAFGMVQVEAMLTGTPVLSSNLPGVRVPVRLSKMGELAVMKDSNDIFTKIKRILDRKKTYTKNINLAKHIFSSKNTYDFYDNFLKNDSR